MLMLSSLTDVAVLVCLLPLFLGLARLAYGGAE